jgi:hypothetical protein
MDEEKILLEEHKELVQLFIHEDSMAWNLINYYIVVNVGILAGIGALFNPCSMVKALISVALCFGGSISGLIWLLFLMRSRMHSDSRMYRAIEIENRLTEKTKIEFDTLKSCEELINFEEKILKKPKGEKRDLRDLYWYEKIKALKFFKYLIIAVSAIWLVFGCFLLNLWLWRFIFPFIN